ncbi:MAG: catalase [Mycoplasmataceae bacterium]|nr:catalase [Mycoplasmataceae bacterium]
MKKTNKKILTSANAIPLEDDNTSLTTGNGKRGSDITALGDVNLVEKLAHFTREKIPERIVHAKGAGAHGEFTLTKDMSEYTMAKFLNGKGKKTPMFVRFSTVGGEKGSADAARDPRGFALKFYTEEGNYDMVGNNTPIFFIRDAMKFPDFVHTQKRDPKTGRADANMFWDFLSLTPESLHQVSFLFSDRGTPKDYRHMDGFSSHTYMWYNKNKDYVWVKYHFITDQGNETLTEQQAEILRGKDPDHATRDLYEAIEQKNFPSWKFCVQIMTKEQAMKYRFDPFDVTKVWFHKDFPLIEIGKFKLNRNPENFFAEVEQVAFAPTNLVPGIAFSPDKLLQGRLFAYRDAQRYRLGVNNTEIPVNHPHVPVHNYQKDGWMTIDNNKNSKVNYFPNSVPGEPYPIPEVAMPKLKIDGTLTRHTQTINDNDFYQTGEFWRRVLSKTDRAHLVSNIAGHLGNARKEIQYRQVDLFYRADKDYGISVAKALGLDIKNIR